MVFIFCCRQRKAFGFVESLHGQVKQYNKNTCFQRRTRLHLALPRNPCYKLNLSDTKKVNRTEIKKNACRYLDIHIVLRGRGFRFSMFPLRPDPTNTNIGCSPVSKIRNILFLLPNELTFTE